MNTHYAKRLDTTIAEQVYKQEKYQIMNVEFYVVYNNQTEKSV